MLTKLVKSVPKCAQSAIRTRTRFNRANFSAQPLFSSRTFSTAAPSESTTETAEPQIADKLTSADIRRINTEFGNSKQFLEFLERIGVSKPNNKQIFIQAVTHASYLTGRTMENDRLEFLGDRILGYFMTENLVHGKPGQAAPPPPIDSGRFKMVQSFTTSNAFLETVGKSDQMRLQEIVRCGKQEMEGRGLDKIIGDTVEAVIGAIYQDQGLAAARSFVHKHILSKNPHESMAERESQKPKKALSEYLKMLKRPDAKYKVVSANNLGTHKVEYEVSVRSGLEHLASGKGGSLEDAQHDAATKALASLRPIISREAQEAQSEL